jgi:hypothetical protein
MVGEPRHTPSWHSPRWHRRHPEVQSIAASSSKNPVTPIATVPLEKHGWRRFGGAVLATGSNLVVTLLVDRGYLRWIPDWALAVAWILCACYWAVAEGHINTLYKKHRRWSQVIALMAIVVVVLSVVYRKEWIGHAYHSKDAPYIPPTDHKAVRFDGQVRPTPKECAGLQDEKEIECLCPRPLDYTLSGLPTPKDNNYATQVEIKAKREAMYRVQLFTRGAVSSGRIQAFPHKDDAGVAVVEMAFDPYTLVAQSSAPQDKFLLEVLSSEGLRLKCINQIN